MQSQNLEAQPSADHQAHRPETPRNVAALPNALPAETVAAAVRRDVRLFWWSRWGGLTVALLCATAYWWLQAAGLAAPDSGLAAPSGLVEFGALGVVIWQSRRIGRRLSRLDDVRAVGPLIDATLGSCFAFGPPLELKRALSAALQRLKASDAGALSGRQRKTLRQMLTGDRWLGGIFHGPLLKVGILKALEQIGDKRDLPAVERLAAGTRDAAVRVAAEECLQNLRARLDAEGPSAALLRPAEEPAPPSALLRPAGAAPSPEPERLLRPVGQGHRGDEEG